MKFTILGGFYLGIYGEVKLVRHVGGLMLVYFWKVWGFWGKCVEYELVWFLESWVFLDVSFREDLCLKLI